MVNYDNPNLDGHRQSFLNQSTFGVVGEPDGSTLHTIFRADIGVNCVNLYRYKTVTFLLKMVLFKDFEFRGKIL